MHVMCKRRRTYDLARKGGCVRKKLSREESRDKGSRWIDECGPTMGVNNYCKGKRCTKRKGKRYQIEILTGIQNTV